MKVSLNRVAFGFLFSSSMKDDEEKDFLNLKNVAQHASPIQILDPKGESERLLKRFFEEKKTEGKNVSILSEESSKKIRRALTPFWQERFISLNDCETLYVKDLLLSEKFFLQTEFFVDAEPFPKTFPELLDEALFWVRLPRNILERKLISLSNGELRRILLARLWMEKPSAIWLDDPFGGLDPEYRRDLKENILNISEKVPCAIIRLCREDEILEGAMAFEFKEKKISETFYEVKKNQKDPGEISKPQSDLQTQKERSESYQIKDLSPVKKMDVPKDKMEKTPSGEILFDLKNVRVRFGETEIIRGLNWRVKKGEHWVIMGPNGAGKSTLLALLSGDHPQIYNNDISLLGSRPGYGLDIWEHKRKIGFYSPELALHYRSRKNVLETLCDSFSEALLREVSPTFQEKLKAKKMLSWLGFLKETLPFEKLSPQEKRLLLIARASIREPEVLILDEPTQGLEGTTREKLFQMLDEVSKHSTILFVSHYDDWPSCMNKLLWMPRLQ